MSTTKLNKEEKQVVADYESGDYISVLDKKRKAELEHTAAETFKKDKRINIRLSSRDLSALQRKALEEGIPYQTLVSSILHKYVSGSLLDVSTNK